MCCSAKEEDVVSLSLQVLSKFNQFTQFTQSSQFTQLATSSNISTEIYFNHFYPKPRQRSKTSPPSPYEPPQNDKCCHQEKEEKRLGRIEAAFRKFDLDGDGYLRCELKSKFTLSSYLRCKSLVIVIAIHTSLIDILSHCTILENT